MAFKHLGYSFIAVLLLAVAGCAGPRNTQVADYTSMGSQLWVTVNPGPPKWCYRIQTISANLPLGIGGVRRGDPFTNVTVEVPGNVCTMNTNNLPAGWTVQDGSHFTLLTTGSATNDLRFCLNCPKSTNGAVTVSVTLPGYNYATNILLSNVSGPRP